MAARLRAILGHLAGPTLIPTSSTAAAFQSLCMRGPFVGSTKKTEAGQDTESTSVESTQTSAVSLLHHVAAVIQAPHDHLHPLVHEAYKKASSSAQAIEGFVKDHPVFCRVIALGMLYILAPTVIQLLGFTAKGPALGTYPLS